MTEGRRWFFIFLVALFGFVAAECFCISVYFTLHDLESLYAIILRYLPISIFIGIVAGFIFFHRQSALIITTDLKNAEEVKLFIDGSEINGSKKGGVNRQDQIKLYFYRPGIYEVIAFFIPKGKNEDEKKSVKKEVTLYPGETSSVFLSNKEE